MRFLFLFGTLPPTARSMQQLELVAQQPQTPATTIVAFGESLTQGCGLLKEDAYPAQPEAALQAKGDSVKVINAGMGEKQ